MKRGVLTLDNACETYSMTGEEFLAWKHAVEQFGLEGLRATRSQEFRRMNIRRTEDQKMDLRDAKNVSFIKR